MFSFNFKGINPNGLKVNGINQNGVTPNSFASILESFRIYGLNYIDIQEIYWILRNDISFSESLDYSIQDILLPDTLIQDKVIFLNGLKEKLSNNVYFSFNTSPLILYWDFFPFKSKNIYLRLCLKYNPEKFIHELNIYPIYVEEDYSLLELFRHFELPHSEQVINTLLKGKRQRILGLYDETFIELDFKEKGFQKN